MAWARWRRQLFSARLRTRSLLGESDGGVGLEVSVEVFRDGLLFAGQGGVAFSGESMFYGILADGLLAGFGDGAGG